MPNNNTEEIPGVEYWYDLGQQAQTITASSMSLPSNLTTMTSTASGGTYGDITRSINHFWNNPPSGWISPGNTISWSPEYVLQPQQFDFIFNQEDAESQVFQLKLERLRKQE